MSFEERPILGWVGFGFAAAALLLVLTHHYGGPFAPQQQIGVSLGEIAADIAKSAARSMVGAAQPAPEVQPRNIDDYLPVAAAVLSGFAAIMGIASLIRHEKWRPAAGALVLASGAMLFQLFVWAILLIIGAMLLVALINNFGDIISF